MSCEEIKNLTVKYFDNDLNENEQTLLFSHLNECNSCKEDFESMKNLFAILERENTELIESREFYFQSLRTEDIIRNKSKKKWFEFELKPAFSFAAVLLIAIGIFYYFNSTDSKLTNGRIAGEKELTQTSEEYPISDFVSSYINQDYLIDNLENVNLSQDDYFKDAFSTLEEIQLQQSNNWIESNHYSIGLDNLSDQEVDEIVALLETKKF